MTRVLVQHVETAGSVSQVFVRDSANASGGAYSHITAMGSVASLRAVAAGTQTAASGTAVFSNSNGITFGMSGSATITASHNGITSQSNQQITAFATSNTTQSSSGTFNANSIIFAGAGGVSVGVSNGSVVISGGAGGAGDGFNRLAAGTQTAGTLATVNFADSNGITFGMSGSTQITASHNGLTSQSNQALSAANGSFTFQTATFANSNGISFSTGTQGIFASHNGLTSQSNQAISGANGSSTFQTASFANSNGLSWSTGTQGFFGSHNGITSQSNQQMTFFATSNTTQSSTMTANASSLIFAGAGVASVGMTNGSVVISVPSGGGGLTNINISAGTTSNNLSQLIFSNGSGVTFGLNSNTITASVNAGGAGPTLSMFPNLPHAWATSSMYTGASTTVGGGSSSTLSWYVAPLILPAAVTFNDVKAILSVGGTIAGTGSGSHRHVMGIYSRNASTLSLVTSFAWNAAHSQNSVSAQTLTWWPGAWSASTTNSSSINGNVSASISGLHEIRLNATSSASSLSAGHYFLAHAYNFRSSSSALFQMGSAWRHSVSQFTGAFGFSNTSGPLMGSPWNGIVSTVTTTPTQFEWVAPATIHSSNISATGGTSRNQWPLVILQSASA